MQEKENQTAQPRSFQSLLPTLGIGFLLTIVLVSLGLSIWMTAPSLIDKVRGTPTPSPLPPTATLLPTTTATITPLPSDTPLPSATPYPASAWKVEDLSQINPPIPGPAMEAIVLNNDTSVTVDPPFSSIRWTNSADLGLGIDFEDDFYATYSAGSATWALDKPLAPGYYQIYVLDTAYSSGGVLDYVVSNSAGQIGPISGRTRVLFSSSFTTPPQTSSTWESIGVYKLDQPDLLTISTTWEDRNEYTIVAIDRVLITRLPDSTGQMLSELPHSGLNYVYDDLSASLTVRDPLFEREGLSWGNRYQSILNPEYDITVTWKSDNVIPVANYEIFVYLPATKGSVEGEFHFLVNGKEFLKDPETIPLNTATAGWASLGVLEIPEVYGVAVNFEMSMKVPAGSIGEVPLDAVGLAQR